MSVDTGTHSGISAAAVPVGAILTYTSSDWHTEGYFTSPDDVLHQVEAALIQDGLTVRSGKTNVSAGASLSGVVTGDISFGVTLQVQVTGGLGYGSIDDVASIINHEVYQATGYLPQSYSIPSIQQPGSGVFPSLWDSFKSLFTGMQQTGQPSTQPGGFSLSNITSSGTLWIGLIILGFVGALALIGYSGALRQRV